MNPTLSSLVYRATWPFVHRYKGAKGHYPRVPQPSGTRLHDRMQIGNYAKLIPADEAPEVLVSQGCNERAAETVIGRYLDAAAEEGGSDNLVSFYLLGRFSLALAGTMCWAFDGFRELASWPVSRDLMNHPTDRGFAAFFHFPLPGSKFCTPGRRSYLLAEFWRRHRLPQSHYIGLPPANLATALLFGNAAAAKELLPANRGWLETGEVLELPEHGRVRMMLGEHDGEFDDNAGIYLGWHYDSEDLRGAGLRYGPPAVYPSGFRPFRRHS